MKRLLIIIIILIIYTPAQQMDRLFWNGSDWKRIEKVANYDHELTYMMKVGYINGVLDGRLFYYLKAWTMEHAFADSLYAETVDYLSPRELVKVLDNFYADPINGYIPLPSAIIICNMFGERIPMDKIDQYIRHSKEWINRMVLQNNK